MLGWLLIKLTEFYLVRRGCCYERIQSCPVVFIDILFPDDFIVIRNIYRINVVIFINFKYDTKTYLASAAAFLVESQGRMDNFYETAA